MNTPAPSEFINALFTTKHVNVQKPQIKIERECATSNVSTVPLTSVQTLTKGTTE